MKYRIYYDDGSTYDGPLELAPTDGVICLWIDHERTSPAGTPYCTFVGNCDYYFVRASDGLIGGNCDPVEEIERRFPGARILRGKWTTTDNYDAIRARAWAERPQRRREG